MHAYFCSILGWLNQHYTKHGCKEYESFVVLLKGKLSELPNPEGPRKICDHLIAFNNGKN